MGDQEIRLTTTEYNLLHELAMHRNHVLPHDQLFTTVWGQEYRVRINNLRSYIRYLRLKIEQVPSEPCTIVTVPGAVYLFVAPEN